MLKLSDITEKGPLGAYNERCQEIDRGKPILFGLDGLDFYHVDSVKSCGCAEGQSGCMSERLDGEHTLENISSVSAVPTESLTASMYRE